MMTENSVNRVITWCWRRLIATLNNSQFWDMDVFARVHAATAAVHRRWRDTEMAVVLSWTNEKRSILPRYSCRFLLLLNAIGAGNTAEEDKDDNSNMEEEDDDDSRVFIWWLGSWSNKERSWWSCCGGWMIFILLLFWAWPVFFFFIFIMALIWEIWL